MLSGISLAGWLTGDWEPKYSELVEPRGSAAHPAVPQSTSVSLRPAALRHHLAFLRRVHVAQSGESCGLYRAGSEQLAVAVDRYVRCWLPLWASATLSTSAAGTESHLVPPLDVAWVWHCHRLAPLKYASFCRRKFGRVLDPGSAAFRLQCPAEPEPAGSAARDLWAAAYPSEPFFAGPSSGSGERAEPRGAGASMVSLGYDVEAAAERQSSFLWQVSGASYEDDAFLSAAVGRYACFLDLVGASRRTTGGKDAHVWVPPYDIDLAWHTHCLASTSGYLAESSIGSGGVPLEHDDSITERHEGGRLDLGWAATKQAWAERYDSGRSKAAAGDGNAGRLAKDGAVYCGEPPTWWFETPTGFLVRDDFVDAAERDALLTQVEAAAAGVDLAACRKGLECRVRAPVELKRRIRALVAASPAPERDEARKGQAGSDKACELVEAALQAPETSIPLGPEGVALGGPLWDEEVEVPARAAVLDVPMHRDAAQGQGPPVEGCTAVLYLGGGGRLLLEDEWTGREHHVETLPGRLVVWPNGRFRHGTRSAKPDGQSLPAARYMVGPMTLTDEVTTQYVNCGGGPEAPDAAESNADGSIALPLLPEVNDCNDCSCETVRYMPQSRVWEQMHFSQAGVSEAVWQAVVTDLTALPQMQYPGHCGGHPMYSACTMIMMMSPLLPIACCDMVYQGQYINPPIKAKFDEAAAQLIARHQPNFNAHGRLIEYQPKYRFKKGAERNAILIKIFGGPPALPQGGGVLPAVGDVCSPVQQNMTRVAWEGTQGHVAAVSCPGCGMAIQNPPGGSQLVTCPGCKTVMATPP
ncbi:hypothetical protein CYMTET_43541 [Cymbomonas tetramitiformis]|uniref:Uncharacterized protein n=1 Tax=Cymbomonas tetramitiformis TaxID=36881 RepID=A0AAE0C208_9CHLO|nr:hypothetical protein CYMTET_43541 [Cymbomonas tetramitiformis]